jgi:hypothetical protein
VVDVTAKLAAQVRNGRLTVQVDNDLAGEDPAFNIAKEVRVEYSVDGAIRNATVAEGDMLALGDVAAAAARSPATFAVSVNGANVELRSAAPGTFNLAWASGRTAEAKCASVPTPLTVSGEWQLSFPPNWGAPPQVKLDRLISWTEHSDAGVRYFSGTAAYEKEFDVPAEFLESNRELWLDLGKVKNLAEVSLNGKPLGILWKPPFRVKISGDVRSGRNRLEVKVTNLWANRLIGDEQLPDDREWQGKRLAAWPQWVVDGKPSPTGRLTFTTWHHWTKEEPLLESGLIGPVTISVMERVIISAAK